MRDSGVAIMGSAQASGEQRALRAVEQAMSSPLLNDSNIKGARYVLVNVTCGEDEITMDELGEITDFIQDAAGMTAEVIKGYGVDFALGDKVSVTIIATGFNSNADLGIQVEKAPGKIIHILDDKPKVFDLHVTPVSNETPVKNEVSEVAEITASVKEDEIPVMENKMDVNQDSAEDFFTFLKEEKTTTNEETKQVTFEFEIAKGNTTIEEPYIISASTEDTIFDNTANTTTVNNTEENSFIAKVQNDEQRKKAQDRVLKLKELSFKLKSPNGLSELENEPAYKRRNINLESTPHSSETQISRYTLSEGEDKKVEIKPNNSFLHDNVD
jgi:cell division protein FtsZ